MREFTKEEILFIIRCILTEYDYYPTFYDILYPFSVESDSSITTLVLLERRLNTICLNVQKQVAEHNEKGEASCMIELNKKYKVTKESA